MVDKLKKAITKIVGQPDVKQAWAKRGALPMVMSPDVFDTYALDDITKWARVIKTANIKVD